MCGLLHGSYGWEDPRLLRWRYSAESKSWICSNLQIRGSVSNSSGSRRDQRRPRHVLTAS
jgi:hypothetical protein